jgi:hypothetical protein
VADQLIGDQHHVFPGDERIEFALALLPLPELVWQFSDPQRLRRRRQDIKEDLEALAGKPPKSPLKDCLTAA